MARIDFCRLFGFFECFPVPVHPGQHDGEFAPAPSVGGVHAQEISYRALLHLRPQTAAPFDHCA